MDLLRALVVASEKAANIARACRENGHLFQLLVQKKKKGDGANPRFVDDFKTLADVLIQEMVKHDIGKQFKELSGHIKGEENNTFSNKLGDKILVEIKPSEEETAELLEKVLCGDQKAALLLAAEVHRNVPIDDVKTVVPTKEFCVNLDELGIWIDPIDCTAEYINGGTGKCHKNINLNGLGCVTILIGAFNRSNGVPMMGVINRPFMDEADETRLQQCLWGVHLPDLTMNSGLESANKRCIISISSSEGAAAKQKLRDGNYELVEACGAGYKILTVILGTADAYFLSKSTTFKWDTCAPHSILKSLGGDIVVFEESLQSNARPVSYLDSDTHCNSGGVIAYRHQEVLEDIIRLLKS